MTQVFLAQILTRLDATDLSNFTVSKKNGSAGWAGPLCSLVFRLSVHFNIERSTLTWTASHGCLMWLQRFVRGQVFLSKVRLRPGNDG